MATAIFVETGEMLQETNWKSWKKPKKIDEEKFKEEIIDIWHFLANLTIGAGMDAKELHERFNKKFEENLRRQKEGY
jgi:dimeric dUTPase (all-alpha-NTP-PPase superfamily)